RLDQFRDVPCPTQRGETCDCRRGRERKSHVVRCTCETFVCRAVYIARTSASAGCKGRRPVACSTCWRQEMPGATTTALGLFSTAGKSRRLPMATEISYCSFSYPNEPAMPQHPESISSTGYASANASFKYREPMRAFS